MKVITDYESVEQSIQSHQPILLYFSSNTCGVCQILRQKVSDLFKNQFPDMVPLEVKVSETPEIAARHMVFSAPTILVLFDGREVIRENRNVSLLQFESAVARIYSLWKNATEEH